MSTEFTKNLEIGMDYLHKQGAFLTVKSGEKVNTMTISWGNIGFEWGKPIFTVLVRKSRFTYELMENSNDFTVSIPLSNELKDALTLCGTKSGREINKFEAANLFTKNSRKVQSPIIGNCELQYECKVLYKHEMDPQLLDASVIETAYKNGDYHTIYYGEIVECYKVEE